MVRNLPNVATSDPKEFPYAVNVHIDHKQRRGVAIAVSKPGSTSNGAAEVSSYTKQRSGGRFT